MVDYTVGRYLADRLAELGLKYLFSIAGDYSIEWVNKYVRQGGAIKVVQEVNEVNACYAADGYARINGIGALCVTYSAGALSAVNGVAGAYVERAPLVLINGTPSLKRTITFEQTGFSSHHFISGRETDMQSFEHITAAQARIDNPDKAPRVIDTALVECISERRPVYIELLEDMIDQPCLPPEGRLDPARILWDAANLKEAISKVGAALQAAKSPIIWAGVEIDRRGLHDEAKALIDALGIPFVTQLMSKSLYSEDDPLFAGVFDGMSSSKEVQDLIVNADFVLALGVWLTDLNTLGWAVDFAKTAFVSMDAVKFGTYFGAQVPLGKLIQCLQDQSLAGNWQPPAQREAPVTPAIDPGETISYQGFYDYAQQFIDENTIVGADASMNYFGAILLEVPLAKGFFVQASYSSIGFAAAAATGVCLAKEDGQRVVVFIGDGGFQMTAQCLSTQARFGLDPIIFMIDNGVYEVEQWLANAAVLSSNSDPFDKSCVLHRWDYVKLAEAMGGQGWTATTYAELQAAFDAAQANRDGPSLIQVVVPAKSYPRNAMWKVAKDQAVF